MRKPEQPFPSFTLVIVTAYPSRYPPRLRKRSHMHLGQFNAYPRTSSVVLRICAAEDFMITVHLRETEPARAPPSPPAPASSPMVIVEGDDTAIQLDQALHPNSSDEKASSRTRRRRLTLSTLVVDLAHAVVHKYQRLRVRRAAGMQINLLV